MRFLETLLILFTAIYVIQLLIAVIAVAGLLLFLGCLFHRPREALILGLGWVGLLAMTRPVGLALAAVFSLGFGFLCVMSWMKGRRRRAELRPIPRIKKYRDDPG